MFAHSVDFSGMYENQREPNEKQLFRGVPGASWGGFPGGFLGRLGCVLGALGRVLGASWGRLGAVLGVLGRLGSLCGGGPLKNRF